MINWDLIIKTLASIFSLLALIVSIVSINSSIQNNKQNNKIVLFEKRFSMYKKIDEIVKCIVFGREEGINGDPISKLSNIGDPISKLSNILDETHFLFSEDVHSFVLLIFNNYSQMLNLIENKNEDYYKLHKWFIGLLEKNELRNIFKRYLSLSDYGLIEKVKSKPKISNQLPQTKE